MRYSFAAILLSLLASCGTDDAVDVQDASSAMSSPVEPRYTRDYIFIGERADAPGAAIFEFQVTDRDSTLERRTRGWLAHADTWDPFLDVSWPASEASGVWNILPHDELRIAVGINGDLEQIRYSRDAQSLDLSLGEPLATWSQGEDTRYRVIDGMIHLGQETTPGMILEILRARRVSREDGFAYGDYDRLFLTDGSDLHLVIAEAIGGEDSDERTFGWVLSDGDERVWSEAEVRWLEMRPLDDARRDIPLRWSLRIPASDLVGEVEALGFDFTLGPDQAGRRAVEIRYTVEGWVERDGERHRVFGVVRHAQA